MSSIDIKEVGNKYIGEIDTATIKVGEYILDVKVTGIRGEDGKSAYDIAVENGYEGSILEWIGSLKGEKVLLENRVNKEFKVQKVKKEIEEYKDHPEFKEFKDHVEKRVKDLR